MAMVANNIKSHATKVTSNNMNMVTRLSHLKPALNIIHVYGQTKGRAGKKKWDKIVLVQGCPPMPSQYIALPKICPPIMNKDALLG